MSDTLNLDNNSQARILLAMIREDLLDKEEGISGYRLCKNHKIPYAVWNENYKKLESKSLIVLDSVNVIQKTKKKNSKKTTRPRLPFLLTELGLVSLFRYIIKQKWIGSRTKKDHIRIEVLTKFIPFFKDNWDRLHSLYELEKYPKLLLTILEYSFNQLQFYQVGNGKESFVKEIMIIYPEITSSHTFNLERFYHGQYFKVGKRLGVEMIDLTTNLQTVEDYVELSITPIDRLAFLFYYNLLRLTRDNSFQLQILQMMDNSFQTTVKKQEIQKLMKKSNPFRKMLQRKDRYLIELIHKDEHLEVVFQKCLDEINEKIISKSLLQNMMNNLLQSKRA